MYLIAAVTVVLCLLGTGSAQHHGGNLHGICHSNHLQLTEDQVIERVVAEMNKDGGRHIELPEILRFFADLTGTPLTVPDEVLENMTSNELLMLASMLRISRDEFTHAWHNKFHDSVPFIQATYDRFDINGDGTLDGPEIEGVITLALSSSDADMDGRLDTTEFVTFLEMIYKNC